MKCIGIMTGNSLDAVDAVLSEFNNNDINDICGHSLPIPPMMADDFRRLKTELADNNGNIRQIYNNSPQQILALHDSYIKLVAQTVNELLQKSGLDAASIDAIGFHGQTCYHRPPSICHKGEKPCSIQIGSGQMLADILNIPVIFDFRSADIKNGGEGAPLAPIHNLHISAKLQKKGVFPVAFCNGGNTGNISIISEDLNDKSVHCAGWDTGPFNHFVDYLARTEQNSPCDFDGKFGQNGHINFELLHALFDKSVPAKDGSNFLFTTPPKSSDPAWYQIIPELTDSRLSFADRIRTAEFFSAYIFVYSLRYTPFNLARPKNFLLFGGGWNNPIILQDFINLLQGKAEVLFNHKNIFKSLAVPEAQIVMADKYGISGKYMEARIFADMAKCFLKQEAFTIPATTGCKSPTICGIIARPGGNNTQLWSQAA